VLSQITLTTLPSYFGHLENDICLFGSPAAVAGRSFALLIVAEAASFTRQRPFLCVPGTLTPHAVAMRSHVTRRRICMGEVLEADLGFRARAAVLYDPTPGEFAEPEYVLRDPNSPLFAVCVAPAPS